MIITSHKEFDEFLNKINTTEVQIKYLLSNSFNKGTYSTVRDLPPIDVMIILQSALTKNKILFAAIQKRRVGLPRQILN